jgi:hypothetical protein
MLVASLAPPQDTRSRRRRGAASPRPSPNGTAKKHGPAAAVRESALVVWLVCGTIALICIPAARGGALLGATLPFWLVGAPLLDLLWLRRQRWLPLIDARRLMPSGRAAPAALRVRSSRLRRSRRRATAAGQGVEPVLHPSSIDRHIGR